ncbi:hypothetical protein Vretimale_17235 [Volvox reticuliferus]|uniref:F-box domain-containing protein n=1 Tax=Volvox reticuliferus TaxID=1737510 RepID=A0A8J4GUL3_9CHLO|nr:hypothetical protein Vretimale_17235 [Volvox reticuliferus]
MVLSEPVSDERGLAPGLADPAPVVVENLCAQFVFDGDSLLRLGQVNKFWHGVVSDVALWERLNAARFDVSAISSAQVPAQPATAIPGWCFFAGLDSGGDDCATPEDAKGNLRPSDLAARADQLGAIAFNTQGWIKDRLQAKSCWKRHSYVPGVGLYVRESAVARVLGVPLPAPLPEKADPQVRPPDFPGWVFYHLVDSPGGDIRHPANGDNDFTSTCSTLEELAEVAARLPSCLAFNTSGSLKHRLQPQVHWRQDSGTCSWGGLYVREDAAGANKLRRPTGGGSLEPCLRYFQLGKTRLRAARDVDVVWLNDTYLMRVPDPKVAAAATAGAAVTDPAGGAPEPLEVVKLSHVCWLDLTGRFNGVGPGRYHCLWVLWSTERCNVAELNFSIVLRSARRLHTGVLAASVKVVPEAKSVSDGEANVPGGGISGEGTPALGTVLDSVVVRGKKLRAGAGLGWFHQPAGFFRVPPGAVYDVEVRLWNHDSTLKSGLFFKELLLEGPY